MSTGMSSGLTGTGLKQISLPNMSPQKQNLYQQVMGGASPGINSSVGYLSKLAGGDMSALAPMEDRAMKEFSGLQGNLASRFSGGFGGGGSGLRKSSGFQNEMGSQATDFASRLAEQRSNLQSNAVSKLMDLYQNLMGTEDTASYLVPKRKKQPWWKSLLGAGLPIAGAGLGAAFGGPMGMAMGGQLGAGLGGAISGSGGGMDFSGLGKLPTKWGG